ncbi:MAG: hypothetical protein ACR2NT_00445 [Acidimicrobiia bacterium]
MRVLVLADHDHDLRVAHILNSEAGVERVAYLGEARSTVVERVDSANGFDLVVGHGAKSFEVATEVGAAVITAAEVDMSPVPAVVGASLRGLGLAMAARLESTGVRVDRVATAQPNGASSKAGSEKVSFPRPVGRIDGVQLVDHPVRVVESSSQTPWAAVMVEAGNTGQAVVDDYRFLEAVALAAAIALVPPAGIVRVWDSPQTYLARAEAMGLVAAERT